MKKKAKPTPSVITVTSFEKPKTKKQIAAEKRAFKRRLKEIADRNAGHSEPSE